MRNITLMLMVAVMGFNGQALAFGDEPAIPAAPVAPKAKEPTLVEKIAKFEKGKTTLADVVKELGQPNQVTSLPDETKHVAYSNVAVSRDAASYIPLVGAYAGKTSIKGEGATLIFDKNDVLKDKIVFQY